jgi:hypothetical protein
MRQAGSCILVLALLGAGGCTRQGPPSPEYQQAQAEFSALYGRHLEDAYLRPEMADLEAKLERVPADSQDANEARALLLRIRSGRERVMGQRAERAEMVRRAREPTPMGREERPEDPPPSPPRPPPQAPDAGAEQPVVGMPVAELTRRFGDCFLAGEALNVEGRGTRPTWKLRDSVFCSQRHPGFDQRVVVEEAGVILAIAERSQVQHPDAGR